MALVEYPDGISPDDPAARQCPKCGQVCRSRVGLLRPLQQRPDDHTDPSPTPKNLPYTRPFACNFPGCESRHTSEKAVTKHLLRTHGIGTKRGVAARMMAQTGADIPTTKRKRGRPKKSEQRPIKRVRHSDENDDQYVDWRPAFLEAYAALGFSTSACDYLGITWKTLDNERNTNPDFARRVQEVEADIKQRRLDKVVAALIEIGVTGRREKIIVDGVVVDERLIRDPRTLQFLGKALAPEVFDAGVRATRIAGQALIMSAEERRAQLVEVKSILHQMVPGRTLIALPSAVVDVEEETDDDDND